MKQILITVVCAVVSMSAFGASKVAVVKLIRGEANVLTLGKTTPLKVDDWVEDGSVVKTEEKSFVKLVFVDKSQMNVGPSSEMKIESFSGKDSGVIDLVKGQIRSQVTKDYLQIQDKDKSKLFIKTQNAVMGVRGTDFMISTNGRNTSTILFEGEIVFNKLEERGEISPRQLEEIVDRGVRLFPNEFSVMEAGRPLPTVPALLNVQQRESLEKNQNFDSNRTPSNAANEVTKTVVPEGLNGAQVSNSVETLKSEVSQVSTVETQKAATPGSSDPDGYVKGNLIKPANGSFVHVESGVIIPPGADSVLDANTNTYIPGQDSGKVAVDGSYIPPKNVEITAAGEIYVQVQPTDPDKKAEIVKVDPVPPVKQGSGESIFGGDRPVASVGGSQGPTPVKNPDVAPREPGQIPGNPCANSGGLCGANDPSRVLSGATREFSDVTIGTRPGN